jgi:hypothetical protein
MEENRCSLSRLCCKSLLTEISNKIYVFFLNEIHVSLFVDVHTTLFGCHAMYSACRHESFCKHWSF